MCILSFGNVAIEDGIHGQRYQHVAFGWHQEMGLASLFFFQFPHDAGYFPAMSVCVPAWFSLGRESFRRRFSNLRIASSRSFRLMGFSR